MKIEKTKQQCQFCGTTRDCVTSSVSEATICYACVGSSKEILGTIPVGSFACLKCGFHNLLDITYSNNSVAQYRYQGLDEKGVAVYVVYASTGSWSSLSAKKSAACGSCGADVPLYMLQYVAYLHC